MRRAFYLSAIAWIFLISTTGADLRVHLEGVRDSLRIGDPLDLLLQISAPPGGYVLLPDWKEVLGDFELLAQPDTVSSLYVEEPQQMEISLRTTCYSTGDQILPAILVRWVSADGVISDSAETEPVIVHVQGVVPDSILALADTTLQPHHLLQSNRRWKLHLSFAEVAPWILGALVVVGVFFLLLRLFRRKRKEIEDIGTWPSSRSPHEIAFEELDALWDKRFYQNGRIKEYYSELSEIIRRYIQARFKLPALESTSFQLLREIEPHLAEENYGALEKILSDADLAKFAKHQPAEEICRHDLEEAYVLVHKTIPQTVPGAVVEAA